MKVDMYTTFEDVEKNYKFRDFFKPTYAELFWMVYELPLTIPLMGFSLTEAVNGRYTMALAAGSASIVPQVLTYATMRGIELLVTLTKKKDCSRGLRYAIRKTKVPSIKLEDTLNRNP